MNTTTFVGLDVHARSIKAVALDAMTGEVRSAAFAYDAAAVAEWVGSLDPAAKCVYESGVTGFDLQKGLAALGVDCVVGAVSKMIKPSADRKRKNDRNDLKRCKQRLSKFLMRHGYAFSETTPTGRRKGNWTAAHWAWIRSIEFPEKADDDVLAYYIDATRRAMEDKKRLEKLVEAEASKPRWKKRVDSLRRLKGVDAMTAAGIVFEAGEFSRFKNARSFAAWLGLTPSEHSSGESVRQGGITKAGNKHLRRVLVEAAWHYISASPHPKDLARGQAPDPAARRHAAKGIRRLVKRREEMLGRGVHKNKANVATARELACWCWAIGRMVENG